MTCLLPIYALPQSISSVTGNNFHSTPPKEKKYVLVNFPMEKSKNTFFKFFIIRSIFNQDKSWVMIGDCGLKSTK